MTMMPVLRGPQRPLDEPGQHLPRLLGIELDHVSSQYVVAGLAVRPEHLSESRADVDRAFGQAQLEHRLRWPRPRTPMVLEHDSSQSQAPKPLTERNPDDDTDTV